jgi:thioredoxin reductase
VQLRPQVKRVLKDIDPLTWIAKAKMPILLQDGRKDEVVPRTALVVAPRFTARAGVLASLGLDAVPQEMNGHVVGSYVPADPMGATAVPGVWVAGNVADLRAQVIASAAAGLNAAAAVNADLIAEDVRLAVAARSLAGAR